MKTKPALQFRVAITQEQQLICTCCGQRYDPNKFRDDVLFGAEKYAVCPLCTYVVPTSVFHDENYRSRCRRVYANQRQGSVNRHDASDRPPSAGSILRGLLDEIAEKRKRKSNNGLGFKVAEKGGVSVYGLARFPLTLYYDQWVRLLDRKDELRAFLDSNKFQLKLKGR